MKRILMSLALLSTALFVRAEMKQALTLHLEDGAQIVYYLDEEPVIGFTVQEMTVTIGGDTWTIPMQSVERWEVGMAAYDGQPEVDAELPYLTVCGNTVKIFNPACATASIYNIEGRHVATANTPEAEFELSSGIYIITIANNSYKIAIR